MSPRVKTGPKGGRYVEVNGNKRYINSNAFCGPAGGAGPRNFPVNSEKRCRAALSYARKAPNPCGIVKCALKKAKKHGWKCGATSCKCGCSKLKK